jgi:hypothetical protein
MGYVAQDAVTVTLPAGVPIDFVPMHKFMM